MTAVGRQPSDVAVRPLVTFARQQARTDEVAERSEALGAWLAVPERIAEWGGFGATRPGTRLALARLHARLLRLGHLLANADLLPPGSLQRLAAAELDACGLDDALLDDVWADMTGGAESTPLSRQAARVSLLDAIVIGLSIAAGLLGVPVGRRD